ncbi:GNAT family N-acetyltransferase [Sphingosinicella microcystinivorans]|uniref:Acetyltransferase (GNAT) family protein n=1 Tax=Sphingosinicella microcystinivorans TaxID=335406 RepID=A0AAD1D506_SPHMI|nr:GNAT family N-acetyltransferase [Sphingosinicella microcystinivorans]RKS90584.1 acetyltransferase (GNAT) family protein [Sphingosinicella microcystinivorans]BBE33498.1 N-acetyltransferase [Sphingosinicella microcystinivorans]
MGTILVELVRTLGALEAIRLLFREYEASLDVDLSYQDFEAELAGLPGKYAPPGGELLLAATADRHPLACAALRAMPWDGACEMKRLFVRPEARGTGVGRALLDRLIETARLRGYRELWLDTVPTMHAAQQLYRRHGFTQAEAYYETPVAGTVFMRLEL